MKRLVQTSCDWLVILSGSALYTIAFQVFLAPAKIAPGGLNGIALILDYLLPFGSVGLFSLVLNLPLLYLAFRHIGGQYCVRTIITTVVVAGLLDLGEYLPRVTEDLFLSALFGGLFLGVGLGLVFLRGSSTAGTDIISRLLRKRSPHISMGKMMLVIDIIVIGLAAVVFQNLTASLYAIAGMFVAARAMDAVLYGISFHKIAYVITDHAEEINKRICVELSRGTTMIPGFGGYTQTPRTVILCALKKQQVPALKRIIAGCDPNAFLIFCEAHEVVGYHFASVNASDP